MNGNEQNNQQEPHVEIPKQPGAQKSTFDTIDQVINHVTKTAKNIGEVVKAGVEAYGTVMQFVAFIRAINDSSFYTQKGPIDPAININRPMQSPFNGNIQNSLAKGATAYCEELHLDWPKDLTNAYFMAIQSSNTMRPIREKLKSNLMYSDELIQAYFVNSFTLAMALTQRARELSIFNVTVGDAVNFHEVMTAEIPDYLRNVRSANSASWTKATGATWLREKNLAQEQAKWDLLVKTLGTNLAIPKTMAEFITHYAYMAFVDQNDGYSPTYIRAIWHDMPWYSVDVKSGVTNLAMLDVHNLDVGSLTNMVREYVRGFAVLQADLAKAGLAQTVFPIPTYGQLEFVVNYDPTFIQALTNAYCVGNPDYGETFSLPNIIGDAQSTVDSEGLESFIRLDFDSGAAKDDLTTYLFLGGCYLKDATRSGYSKCLPIPLCNVVKMQVDKNLSGPKFNSAHGGNAASGVFGCAFTSNVVTTITADADGADEQIPPANGSVFIPDTLQANTVGAKYRTVNGASNDELIAQINLAPNWNPLADQFDYFDLGALGNIDLLSNPVLPGFTGVNYVNMNLTQSVVALWIPCSHVTMGWLPDDAIGGSFRKFTNSYLIVEMRRIGFGPTARWAPSAVNYFTGVNQQYLRDGFETYYRPEPFVTEVPSLFYNSVEAVIGTRTELTLNQEGSTTPGTVGVFNESYFNASYLTIRSRYTGEGVWRLKENLPYGVYAMIGGVGKECYIRTSADDLYFLGAQGYEVDPNSSNQLTLAQTLGMSVKFTNLGFPAWIKTVVDHSIPIMHTSRIFTRVDPTGGAEKQDLIFQQTTLLKEVGIPAWYELHDLPNVGSKMVESILTFPLKTDGDRRDRRGRGKNKGKGKPTPEEQKKET